MSIEAALTQLLLVKSSTASNDVSPALSYSNPNLLFCMLYTTVRLLLLVILLWFQMLVSIIKLE